RQTRLELPHASKATRPPTVQADSHDLSDPGLGRQTLPPVRNVAVRECWSDRRCQERNLGGRGVRVVSWEAWTEKGNAPRSTTPPGTRCLLSPRSPDGSDHSPIGRGPSTPDGLVAESIRGSDSRCAWGNLDCHQRGVEARAPRSAARVIA